VRYASVFVTISAICSAALASVGLKRFLVSAKATPVAGSA
jgi:hypothetical protein